MFLTVLRSGNKHFEPHHSLVKERITQNNRVTPSNTGEFVPAGASLLKFDDEPSGTVQAPFVYRVTDSSPATFVLKGTDGSERGDEADLLGQPAFL